MAKTSASVLAAAVLLAVGCGDPLHASVDMFLDLGADIPGESVDSVYHGKVDVLAWSWGMSGSGTNRTGAGGVKSSFQGLSVTKYVDSASPPLLLHCANGALIPQATLILRATGSPAVEFLKITLANVLVTSVSTGGSGGQDRLTENVALDFAQMTLTYTPVVNAQAQTGLYFTWSIPDNTGSGGSVGGPPPTPVAGLTSTLTYVKGAPVATLTWRSTAGASYQVWAAGDANAAFQRYGSPTASTGDGTTSITLPANAIRQFFRIETVSGQ